MTSRWPWIGALLLLGIGWGSTQSLGKIAASGGAGHFLLIFWQLVIGVFVLGLLLLVRRRRLRLTWPGVRFALLISVIGTIIPNSAFYMAVHRLPAGIMSILISMVPLLAFPIALALGMDRFSARRFLGIACGLVGVALIAQPGAAGGQALPLGWIALAMVGPFFYAIEGNVVARWGTAGLEPMEAMFLASLIGAPLALALTMVSGQWVWPSQPFGRPEWALIGSSALHALLYTGYVALAARAGAVFATQTSYIVTASGVFWAMALLGERFNSGVWAALIVMFAGLFLVTPRARTAVSA
ncbi:MAG TPA: DMT family transporter [Paracoccaceae bacterium]|nr:DMT family transporter [Paracoccaceae bacterium]